MESTADKIVAEVKSQGVFDQFRRDSIAQVDTKPAYINLIQRVQQTVNKFLSSKTWGPEMNKIQLRERLRRHITDSSFLELGVERIVDQVVNPKISTTFEPQIENIAFVALGIEKPTPKNEDIDKKTEDYSDSMNIIIPNGSFMPQELEQISPDSDKMTINQSDSMDTSDDKTEDFESPEFEPLLEPIENNSNDNFDEQKENCEDPKHDLKSKVECENEINKVDIKVENDKAELTITQESNLSQVSSLSIVSESGEDTNLHASISENAQMPKFNDNSNSLSEEVSIKSSNFTELAFNIKKDEIKFEGTDRKIKVESPDLFPEEKLEEDVNKTDDRKEVKVKFDESQLTKESEVKEEVKVKLEKTDESASVDGVSTPKLQKEKSKDHHSSSSHKKSSRDKDKERKSDRNDRDKDRKSSVSSSYKKYSSSSSKDRHSKSSSSKHKSKYSDKSYSSSKERHHSKNDKCSKKPSEYRRKSTDSNDDNAEFDKKISNIVNNNENKQKESNLTENNKQGTSTNDSTTPSESEATIIPSDEEALCYFDNPPAMPVNYEDFESTESKLLRSVKLAIPSDDVTSVCSQRSTDSLSFSPISNKRKIDDVEPVTTETKATLIIDCVDYSNYEYAHKKFKSALHKVSPTSSELSVGSKENLGSSSIPRKPAIRKSMVSNQRYSSEDLYKPRPILSQRSRRRDIDTNIL